MNRFDDSFVRSSHRLVFVCYSRQSQPSPFNTSFVDFDDPASFTPSTDLYFPSVFVSFAPIWKFAPFFDFLSKSSRHVLSGLRSVVACSSSSVVTKRFAFSSQDKALVSRLQSSEDQLLNACNRLSIPCQILRPSIVYGRIGSYSDSNVSVLLRLMRMLPVLPIPATPGLHQPIHIKQLASVALKLPTLQIVLILILQDLAPL